MSEPRTPQQLREHYEIERELANRLRAASKQERRGLYSALYDELFRRVPHHPQLTGKSSPDDRARDVALQMAFLKPLLTKESTFLEVGPGDCSLSFAAAQYVRQVYAVDVSDEITKATTTPGNFQLILSDGCSIAVPGNSVDVAYSYQLMEHLHPDDAFEQLRNIYNALTPGGSYVCITPNRLTGPHDVSRYFDRTATGFHLREYGVSELTTLFGNAGFSNVRVYAGCRGIYKRFPAALMRACERLLSAMPFALRNPIAHSLPFRVLLNCNVVAIK
jgi:SAM-dependent methyltransferase